MEEKVTVESLREFDFTPEPRTRKSQYDWDVLFNGGIHKVTGVSKTFETTVQRNADKYGAEYQMKRVDDETVVIQATNVFPEE